MTVVFFQPRSLMATMYRGIGYGCPRKTWTGSGCGSKQRGSRCDNRDIGWRSCEVRFSGATWMVYTTKHTSLQPASFVISLAKSLRILLCSKTRSSTLYTHRTTLSICRPLCVGINNERVTYRLLVVNVRIFNRINFQQNINIKQRDLFSSVAIRTNLFIIAVYGLNGWK